MTKFLVEIEVVRSDGKRELAQELVRSALEDEVLNLDGNRFYPVTEAGTEVSYTIKSVSFFEVRPPAQHPGRGPKPGRWKQ